MSWSIEKFEGVGPIRFGMSVSQLQSELGQPSAEPEEGQAEFLDFGVRVSLENGRVVEISVTPDAGQDVLYEGLSCFAEEPLPALRKLEQDGGGIYDDVGFLLFPKLGIMATGIHDGDRSQLAVTVLPAPMPEEEYEDADPISFK